MTHKENKLMFYYMIKRFIMMMLEIDFLYEVGIELWSVMVSNVDKEALKTELQRDLLTPTSSLCQLLGGLYV